MEGGLCGLVNFGATCYLNIFYNHYLIMSIY